MSRAGSRATPRPDETLPIYDAAMKYQADGTPLVVLAGKEYGTGSSRDWAAKGTVLLGVRAVIAESFERIHRSNLVGMGVLPLQFQDGETATSLGLDGTRDVQHPRRRRHRAAPGRHGDGDRGRRGSRTFTARCRIDTYNELEYFHAGGILPYVLQEAGGLSTRTAACHCGKATIRLPRRPDHVEPVQLHPVHQDGASRASIFRSEELAIEGEFDAYVRSDLTPVFANPALLVLRDRHPLGAARRAAARADGGECPAARSSDCSKACDIRQVDGASWDE